MSNEPKFTEQLRAALESSGMSMAELARASGVRYDIIQKLLAGVNRSTSAENAELLRKTLAEWWESPGSAAAAPQAAPRAPHATPRRPSLEESFRIAILGDRIEITAVVKSDEVDDLIRRIALAKRILDGDTG